MPKKFGTTWWGEQWLNSIQNIDYRNRIPRGASYARTRAVKSINIKDGNISACVGGTKSKPYKEIVTVPLFDKENTQIFIDRLIEQPLILASLMQRQLDPEVLKIAEECGLQVFPKSWQDLSMECNCHDWAVPCKHLAAVIYKICEEIDNNPFLLFELHGLNLLNELKKRGLLTDTVSKNLNPASIDTLIKPISLTKDNINDWTTSNPDFSKLPEIGEKLFKFLTDDPPFSISGDFKKTYTKQLDTISKSITKTLNEIITDEDGPEVFEQGTEIRFRIDKTSYNTEVILTSPTGDDNIISFADFTERLAHIKPAMYLTSQPWVESLHKMWLLAANLLSRKDVVPTIVVADKDYRILWQPAMLHDEIRKIVKSVTDLVPAKAVVYGKKYVLNAGEWLLFNMLNVMIVTSSEPQNLHKSLFDLFFLDTSQTFKGIGQNSIAGGIKVWTDKFFMLNKEGGFSLWVDDDGSEFLVNLYIALKDSTTHIVKHIPFANFIENPAFATKQIEVLTKLHLLIDYLPELRSYVIEQGTQPIKFNSQSFVPFLFKTLPLVRLLGVEAVLPKSLRELATPKITVKIDCTNTGDSKSYLRIDELLRFSWEVTLGDEVISDKEFKYLMLHAGELIKFKGRYIFATPEELARISSHIAKRDRLSPQEILAIALAETYNDAPVTLTKACQELLSRVRHTPGLPLPSGLQADLRPYQQRGYEWLMHNLTLGFGAIIADDMGLGKTLQVITAILKLKESGRLDKRKVLVVVPTGLLTNWQKECARFAPTLNVSIYHGPTRNLDTFEGDVMLTSYGVMRSDVTKLKKLKWELLVIDEAQNIKNSATAQAKAINSVPATVNIAMSGTPVENRLSEYWSIMNFANKGLLGTLKEFNKQYGRPIQLEGNKEAAERFKATTSPFMLRRLKSDKSIISDLPDKIERDEYASLTSAQSALYQQTLNEAMREIEGITGRDHASLFKREGLVLQMIMALKQICNHPAQFLKTKQADAELSGKAMLLLDLVRGIVDSGEKVLIFTQFREMGNLIMTMLEKIDISAMFYHGGTPLKKRTEMIERFQNQRSAQVFVLSLKAAGTGLNLTAATNVIHFDLWWNPAVEAQATDRAYRIGQHRNVQVYRFIAKGTFEEKINTMIQDKKRLADLTVTTGEKWLAEMSDSELRSIFTLDAHK